MAEPENKDKKKNIFDKAVDALSNRDEKEAAAKAEAEAKAAKEAQARVQAEAQKAKLDLAKAQAEAAKSKLAAEAQAKEAEALKAKMAAMQQQQANEAMQKATAARLAAAAAEEAQKTAEAKKAAEAAAVIKHVWTKEDTYASLAQKYYGSFKEPYWRLIYDHNKAIIGNHPNAIRVGLEIEIPPLPEELKLKK
jgi:colicin import membrane protein